jgi:repressor LexA
MRDLTDRQREVLAFVSEYISQHAYPPTIREIATNFSISVKGAYDHLAALRKKNRIRYGDKRSRTLEIIKCDQEEPECVESYTDVPLLGSVAAGKPIMAEENWDGIIPVPRTMLRRGNRYFALRVRGDSMIHAGILDGDLAVIESRENAENGDIVVAMLEGSAEDTVTLKRFYRESSRIRLQPENPAYSPLYCQNVRILGKMACLLRSYHKGF